MYISLLYGLITQLAIFRDIDALAILGLLYVPAWLICITSSVTLITGSLILSDNFKTSWKNGGAFGKVILMLGTLIIAAAVGFISFKIFSSIFWSDELLNVIFDF